MKKYKPIVCKLCKCKFTPRSGYASYCDGCKPIAKKLYNRERYHKKQPGAVNWPEIIRICEENHVSYGNAVSKGLIK